MKSIFYIKTLNVNENRNMVIGQRFDTFKLIGHNIQHYNHYNSLRNRIATFKTRTFPRSPTALTSGYWRAHRGHRSRTSGIPILRHRLRLCAWTSARSYSICWCADRSIRLSGDRSFRRGRRPRTICRENAVMSHTKWKTVMDGIPKFFPIQTLSKIPDFR